MKKLRTSRRRFLQFAAGASVVPGGIFLSGTARASVGKTPGGVAAALGDDRILIEFDPQMRSRVWHARAVGKGEKGGNAASGGSVRGDVGKGGDIAGGGHIAGAGNGESARTGGKSALTGWAASETVVMGTVVSGKDHDEVVPGARLERFALREQSKEAVDGPLGHGNRLRLVGVADSQGVSGAPVEKTVQVELFDDYPGFALYQVSYRNVGARAVTLASWTNVALRLSHGGGRSAHERGAVARTGDVGAHQGAHAENGAGRGGDADARGGDGAPAGDLDARDGDAAAHGGDAGAGHPTPDADASGARSGSGMAGEPLFWSFCGSTHEDRRDWVQPVRAGFEQQNFMGMSASDYGGGTPIVDVWRRDGGVAIGHLETTPRLVSLPLSCTDSALNLSMTAPLKHTLQPGEVFNTPETFVATHAGDYFSVLAAYRRIMATRGIASPHPPKAAYEAVWCAWGYERDCTLQLIVDTLPKVRELGLKWAVIDDGWQTNVGDWNVSRVRYPRGEDDMRDLVKKIRAQDLKARLWWAPLGVAPGSDLLHDHTDMLLRNKDGAVENISWWNSFYLCPAYQPTVDYSVALVKKFIGDWGYAGLKIDGQHLNSVAPCYNPAHKHARPEESVEKLQDFFQAIYQAAVQANPEAVVELCPCGTSYSFFNFRSFNSAPASDPESSWQVRHKGKSLKALMGPSAAFAGDHVELSKGGADFASTVGIGGIVSTKFTWPVDPKPKDSFLLTSAKEPLWKKWIALYNERQLPLGTYRGELYDIGFDKPETHVIEKDGRFYYAFYGRNFSGPVPLRGLTGGSRYRVRDYFNDRELGEVSGGQGKLQVAFSDFLVIEAVPV